MTNALYEHPVASKSPSPPGSDQREDREAVIDGQDEHPGAVVDVCGAYRVIACLGCGFRHLTPIPSSETVNAFYEKEYYQARKIDYIEKDLVEERYWRISFRERLDFVEKAVGGRRLLDIGCGSGRFLRYAQDRGWACAGIEPSDVAAQVGRRDGLEILTGTLADFAGQNTKRFDVVHLKNVLEHVPNPGRVLVQCRDLLRPGGLLYVEVPNDYNLVQRVGVTLARERKSWICVPDHINYFDFSTLGQLLRTSGFRIIKRDTTFPMYMFLWFGQNFIRHKKVGSRAHRIRMALELGLERAGLGFLKRGVYSLLSQMGLGRTVIFHCRA